MYTCEAMERNKLQVANQYFTHLASKQTNTLDGILNCTMGDPNVLKKLTGECCQFFIERDKENEWLQNLCNFLLYMVIFCPFIPSDYLAPSKISTKWLCFYLKALKKNNSPSLEFAHWIIGAKEEKIKQGWIFTCIQYFSELLIWNSRKKKMKICVMNEI